MIDIKKSYFIRNRLPALIWAALIFIASSIPRTPKLRVNIFSLDKMIHFVEFGIFGILLLLFFSGYRGLSRRSIAVSLFVGIVWAALDEYHQFFVPGRNPSVYDFMADVAGIFLFQFVFLKNNFSKMRKAVL